MPSADQMKRERRYALRARHERTRGDCDCSGCRPGARPWLKTMAQEAKARLAATEAICKDAAAERLTAEQAAVRVNALAPPPPVIAKPAPVVRVPPPPRPVLVTVPARPTVRAMARLERAIEAVVVKHLSAAPPPPSPAPVNAAQVAGDVLKTILPVITAAIAQTISQAAAARPKRVIKRIERDASGRPSAVIEEAAD